MTVRRQRTVRLPTSPELAREAIRRALAANVRYVSQQQDGDRWTVRVRPVGWPLVVSTTLTIEITDIDADDVTVVASTTSPRLIMGDGFGMYDAYLNGFEASLTRFASA